jgi:hypothetical protein
MSATAQVVCTSAGDGNLFYTRSRKKDGVQIQIQ